MASDDELLAAFTAMEERFARGETIDVETLCAQHPAHADRLRDAATALERVRAGFSELRDIELSPQWLEREVERAGTPRWLRIVDRIRRARSNDERYAVEERLGSGASGDVHRTRDLVLERDLAMKIARTSLHDSGGGASELRWLRRLLAEARLTARLDHPGVVPVHDLGIDEAGHVYFTMRRVEGVSFTRVIELARAGRERWNEFRALEVLLKVCDTLAYAHSLRIVHRDLKPENVLVGAFGETYVVDWGLACALDERSQPDPLRLSESDVERAADRTLHGDVLGTPCYMPPEQAAGLYDAIDERSDVYAVGAVLYQLLGGSPPYLAAGEKPAVTELVERVRAGPPRSLAQLAPNAPPELVAICEKAMARDKDRRYAGVGALAADLRRYLAGHVVTAYERGAWAELKKLVLRNRIAAASVGIALAAALLGLGAAAWSNARTSHALEAQADAGRIADLDRRAKWLWPATPARLGAIDAWLAEAEDLRAGRDAYARERDAMRPLALPFDPKGSQELAALALRAQRIDELLLQRDGCTVELLQLAERPEHPGATSRAQFLRQRVARIDSERERVDAGRAAWVFADRAHQGRHDFLTSLIGDLDRFFDPDPLLGTFEDVRRRRAFAARIERESVDSRRGDWERAIADVADPVRRPSYAGLTLVPQIGLIPLGPDSRSGLWEFALLASGRPPDRGPGGRLVIEEDSAVVLVLVPGGEHRRWWRPAREELPTNMPGLTAANSSANDPERCSLDPFFVSKYEMSQAQWQRLTDDNPSYFHAGASFPDFDAVALDPVEQVSWYQAREFLPHWGLDLPTEAQWEWAARAGTTTMYWWGDDNFARFGRANMRYRDFSDRNDYGFLAPIDALESNPFGLHNVIGNVWEWTADTFWSTWAWPMRDGDGLALAPESGLRSCRGASMGCTLDGERELRLRTDSPPFRVNAELGVRPVRALDR